MDAGLKKILKSVTLELRHLLEGRYDAAGVWLAGDLEHRLASLGVRSDRESRPIDELHLTPEDQHARKVVDAYLKLRDEAGVARTDAVAEFLRETSYTWANRLIALRCMESRELNDPVILQQPAYGGRSLEHHRLAQRQPELCTGEDDGLFAVLDKVFREQTQRLPMLFDPQAPGIALRPSPAAIKDCLGLLSLDVEALRKHRIRIREDENAVIDPELPNPFVAPDALGWTYQFWNTEEKERVFERVRTVKGAKIAGADIVPATQLYTEDYMVKFLVQNSLGASWMQMHPQSRLSDGWEYYVRDTDREPITSKPLREVTFLDPACGSGHFLLEAFDLYYAMYEDEGEITNPEEICTAILSWNLFGIDIDARAVQIAEAALWMKAAEREFDYSGAATNLVAASASHLKGAAWDEFLAGFEREPSVARVLRKFAQTMEHIDEIGSLACPAEDLREIVHEEHTMWERQVREKREANYLFPEMRKEALSGQLPFNEITDQEFGERLLYRAKAGIDAFTERARDSGEFDDQMLASETRAGFRLVDLLGRQYDVIGANPPFMGKGSMSGILNAYCQERFPQSFYDTCMVFIERILRLLRSTGFSAVVTQQTLLNLPAYDDLRREMLESVPLYYVVQLGTGAFESIGGAKVNPILMVFGRGSVSKKPVSFIRVAKSEKKSEDLRLACSNPIESEFLFRRPQSEFLTLPRCMVLYSLTDELFQTLRERTMGQCGDTYSGLLTGDNERLLRQLCETSSNSNFRPYTKGGPFCRWFGNLDQSVRWDASARVFFSESSATRLAGLARYFDEGLTWSDLAGIGLSVRYMPPGFIFDQKGPAYFVNQESDLYAHLAFLNSSLCRYLAEVFNPNATDKVRRHSVDASNRRQGYAANFVDTWTYLCCACSASCRT
jgi:SAM-dependent methyltransferase